MQIHSMDDLLTINPTLTPDKNKVVRKKDYYISYNPCTFDEGKEETAIYDEVVDKFYILYGDFRRAYSAFTTLEECKNYFKVRAEKYPEDIGYTSDTCE